MLSIFTKCVHNLTIIYWHLMEKWELIVLFLLCLNVQWAWFRYYWMLYKLHTHFSGTIAEWCSINLYSILKMKRKMKHAEQRRRMRKKKKNEIYRSVRNINVARNSNQNYAQSIKFSVRYLSQRLILITLSEFHNTKKNRCFTHEINIVSWVLHTI